MFALTEILNQMFRAAEREGQDADRCCLIGAVQKRAGIAHIQIRDVVRLPKAISVTKFFGSFPIRHVPGTRLTSTTGI